MGASDRWTPAAKSLCRAIFFRWRRFALVSIKLIRPLVFTFLDDKCFWHKGSVHHRKLVFIQNSAKPVLVCMTKTKILLRNGYHLHCNENPMYVFLFWKWRGISPSFCFPCFCERFIIPRIGLPIGLQQNKQTDPGNILISHRYMSVGIGRQNIIILFWK